MNKLRQFSDWARGEWLRQAPDRSVPQTQCQVRGHKLWSRSAMGERAMIETPILVLIGVLAVGAIVWWLYG